MVVIARIEQPHVPDRTRGIRGVSRTLVRPRHSTDRTTWKVARICLLNQLCKLPLAVGTVVVVVHAVLRGATERRSN